MTIGPPFDGNLAGIPQRLEQFLQQFDAVAAQMRLPVAGDPVFVPLAALQNLLGQGHQPVDGGVPLRKADTLKTRGGRAVRGEERKWTERI